MAIETRNQSRTLTTARGRTVTTTLTDEQAIELCRGMRSNSFARDLAAKSERYPLSHDQMVWAHILAMEHSTPVQTVSVGSLDGLTELLSRPQSLKQPRLRVALNGGDDIVVLTPKDGAIKITDENRTRYVERYGRDLPLWYGQVEAGEYKPSRTAAPEGLVEALQEFSQDAFAAAVKFGRLTGRCCFCARRLDDLRSTTVGFGETCAKHYGMHELWKGALEGANDAPAPVSDPALLRSLSRGEDDGF